MLNSFKMFFAAITTMFSAFDKTMKAADHLAGWAEESAGALADKARYERQQDMTAFRAKYEANQVKVVEAEVQRVTKK